MMSPWLPPASTFTSAGSLLSRGSLWALCSLSLFCPREVCYDRLGCYDADMPWFDVVFRPILLLPQSPAQVDVRFFFTSTTRYLTSLSQLSSLPEVALPTSLQEEEEALASIEAANVDLDSPIVFIVHGFVTSDASDWILGMRDAFLRFHGTNVVRVGWNTSPPNYQMVVVVVGIVFVVVVVGGIVIVVVIAGRWPFVLLSF